MYTVHNVHTVLALPYIPQATLKCVDIGAADKDGDGTLSQADQISTGTRKEGTEWSELFVFKYHPKRYLFKHTYDKQCVSLRLA
jgi:hypothetical protein